MAQSFLVILMKRVQLELSFSTFNEMQERIKLNVKTAEKIRPLAVFFDSLSDEDFVRYVDYLTKSIGIGMDGVTGCTFPNNLDEYQIMQGEGFDGIQFSFYEEDIEVDVPTFRKYLRMACEIYWQEHPESKEILEEYLARPQPPLEEGTLEEWKSRRDAGEYPKPYSEFDRD